MEYERFQEILLEVSEEIPEQFYEELNGSVVIARECKLSPYAVNQDLYIMGEYRTGGRMGNQVTIYYGSFCRVYPHATEEFLRSRLRETLRHELKHHMEHRAGTHELEDQDRVDIARYLGTHGKLDSAGRLVYRKGTKADERELLAFLNGVFKEDFLLIMKKGYQDREEYGSLHHLLWERGRLVGVVGVYEQVFHAGRQSLKSGYVGSVSVKADARGNGFMRQLMQQAEKEMRSKRIALAVLAGARNRYGFFGYELGGMEYCFQVNQNNIRHTIGLGRDRLLSILPVGRTDAALEEIYALYEKKVLRSRTRDNFFSCCQTWNSYLYQIVEGEELCGYVILDRDSRLVRELQLTACDRILVLRVLRALLERNPQHTIEIHARAYETEVLQALLPVCEGYQLLSTQMYRILDYPAVLQFFLELKAQHTNLEDGSLLLEVSGEGSFQMTVENGRASVREVLIPSNPEGEAAAPVLEGEDQSKLPPKLMLRPCEVFSVLCSPAFLIWEGQQQMRLPRGWFPFSFSPADVDQF